MYRAELLIECDGSPGDNYYLASGVIPHFGPGCVPCSHSLLYLSNGCMPLQICVEIQPPVRHHTKHERFTHMAFCIFTCILIERVCRYDYSDDPDRFVQSHVARIQIVPPDLIDIAKVAIHACVQSWSFLCSLSFLRLCMRCCIESGAKALDSTLMLPCRLTLSP